MIVAYVSGRALRLPVSALSRSEGLDLEDNINLSLLGSMYVSRFQIEVLSDDTIRATEPSGVHEK